MRYCCPDNQHAMVDERTAYWMPMDQYIGGIEHAVLHLLYARFWTKVMRDLGLVTFDEPFTRLFTQGMLLNESFYREDASGKRRWFYPTEVELKLDERGKVLSAVAREDGQPVMLGGTEKMSKSKNNVVEPKDIVARFGADTARLFTMFAGPPELSAIWSDSSVEGANRFLRGLWGYCHAFSADAGFAARTKADLDPASLSPDAQKLRREVHVNLKQISDDYARLKYNTVVSGSMKMFNALDEARRRGDLTLPGMVDVMAEGTFILLRVLYPVTPHIGFAAWRGLGFEQLHGELIDAVWPLVDDRALLQDEISLVVQVNGKLRATIKVAADASREEIEKAAQADLQVQKFLVAPVKKIHLVPGRLVNIVV
jgi:leucyl-tRNA synthetase